MPNSTNRRFGGFYEADQRRDIFSQINLVLRIFGKIERSH
jgi:hypothetical protein